MKTIAQTIYYPATTDTFRLWYLTDLHLGNKACDEKRLRADVARIAADPGAYWIGGGDYLDAICQTGDKRYKPETLSPWALGYTDLMGVQRDYAVELLAPIANKCLGLGAGNHENNSMAHYDRNLYWEFVTGLAQRAGVPPESLGYGYQGFILISFRRGNKETSGNNWRFTVYAHHGYGGGRMPGGHALTLGRALGDYEADLMLFGHRHVFQAQSKVITAPGPVGKTGRTAQRWAVFMPSYLRSWMEPNAKGQPVDTYPELVGLPATPVGAFPIEIKPYAHRITLQIESECLGRAA